MRSACWTRCCASMASTATIFYSVARFIARTPSRLMAISLEDLLGVVDQPNIPGTVDEHPNWRQRLPVAVEEIAAKIDVDGAEGGDAGADAATRV